MEDQYAPGTEASSEAPALPWNTGPTGQGAAQCDWCGRTIYRPALPCSIAPIEGLARMVTAPGSGDRCKYELATRTGMAEPGAAAYAAEPMV